MCGKQPFNVSASQLDIFERVATPLYIWRGHILHAQENLPLQIDLWFCTPDLSLLLPVMNPCQSVLRRRLFHRTSNNIRTEHLFTKLLSPAPKLYFRSALSLLLYVYTLPETARK